MQLKDKVAIVTGAAYGIGFAAAERFYREGATVVLSDIKGHEEAAAKLTGGPGEAVAIRADVTSDESVNALVSETARRFGTVHILVNNAAMSADLHPGRFEEQSSELWKRVYDVNVIGPFRASRAVSPYMRAQKWGRIINLSSGTAFKGTAGMLHYIASKGAIISMTRSLATEFGADHVTVNAVSPGFTLTESVNSSSHILTEFAPKAVATRAIKRDGRAVDVANVIFFLASEDGGWMSGQTLAADGGSVFH
jgi:NAD(P)-dependent dehydrogenase (short-subunit alcohol dehydrogenase family)